MPSAQPQLWQFRSEVLNGYYMSKFVVIAASKEEAVEQVMAAFEAHIQEQFDMMFSAGSFQILDEGGKVCDTAWLDSTDEEELAENKPRVLQSLRQEAEAKLDVVQSGALCLHHSG